MTYDSIIQVLFLVTKEARVPGPGEEPEEKSCKMGLINLTSFVGDSHAKSLIDVQNLLLNKQEPQENAPQYVSKIGLEMAKSTMKTEKRGNFQCFPTLEQYDSALKKVEYAAPSVYLRAKQNMPCMSIFHPRADAHIPLSLPLFFSHR